MSKKIKYECTATAKECDFKCVLKTYWDVPIFEVKCPFSPNGHEHIFRRVEK